MRLLMKINYQEFLFPAGADVTEILKAADGIRVVDKDYRSGVLKVKDDATVSFELIPDESVTLPDAPNASDYEQFHKVATERDKLEREVRELKAKIKKFETATEVLRYEGQAGEMPERG